MAANSNYYGYSTGVQGSQVYGSTMQSPQMAQSAYSAQNTAAYGAQSTTPSAGAYGTPSPRSVMPAQAAYTPTAASSYQTTGLSGSSYGYTARVQDTTTQNYQANAQSAHTSQSPYGYYYASRSASYNNQHASTSQQAFGYGYSATSSMYSFSNSSYQPAQGQQRPRQRWDVPFM